MTGVMNATSTLSGSTYKLSGIEGQYAFPVAMLILSAVAAWLIYTAIKDNY